MIADLRDSIQRIADLGGPVVLLLCALSVVVLAVVLYKLWQFAVAGVGRHKALTDAISAWDAGDRTVARDHLGRSRSYLAPVIAMALDGQTDAARLEAEAEARFARLESGFRLLDSVAQLAPLLGLFGTVLGMISAFQALQEAGAQVDPSILAGGIWVALLTTAVGLAVAMPTSVVLSWFEARMDADRVLAQKAVHTVLSPDNRAPSRSPRVCQPMRSLRRRRRLSMTSLIDVIFLLLLFFMLSSTFTRFAEVEFASAGSGNASSSERPVFLSLAADALRVNGTETALGDLSKALEVHRDGDKPLGTLVSAGADVTSQRLTDLLVTLRSIPGVLVTVLEGS